MCLLHTLSHTGAGAQCHESTVYDVKETTLNNWNIVV